MATIIYRTEHGTEFITYGSAVTKKTTIPSMGLSNITKKVFGKRVKLIFHTNCPQYHVVPVKFDFDYEAITYPASGSPDDLINKIMSLNYQENTLFEFVSTEGQTTFPIATYGYKQVAVFLNGAVQVSGVDYEYNLGTNVIFNSALSAGDQITILKP